MTAAFSRAPMARRLFASLALLLAVPTVVLLVSPITISAPIALTEALLVLLGLIVLLLANLMVIHRVLGPLERLAREMPAVDLLQPDPGLAARVAPRDREVTALLDTFQQMIDRLSSERRASGRRALAAQEAERLRIARELHDEVGQTLTAVSLQLERDGGPELEHLRVAVDRSLADERRIARELRPEALDDLGLVNALLALASRVTEQSGLTVVRQIVTPLPVLDPDVELVLYRIAQESLTNVVRHAHARSATIDLSADEHGAVVLAIRDDGVGLPEGVTPGGGIQGMRERALLVGGTLSIGPRAGGGTSVVLALPGVGA